MEVDRPADSLHVTIRAIHPDVAWGFRRTAENAGGWDEHSADQLRSELAELTGKRVRLFIRETPGPHARTGEETSD